MIVFTGRHSFDEPLEAISKVGKQNNVHAFAYGLGQKHLGRREYQH